MGWSYKKKKIAGKRRYRALKRHYRLKNATIGTRVSKTRDLCGIFSPTHPAKRVYKTRFLIESRVFKTRDVTFLKTLKRFLTYYFESLLTTILHIPSHFLSKLFHLQNETNSPWLVYQIVTPPYSSALMAHYTLLFFLFIQNYQSLPHIMTWWLLKAKISQECPFHEK